MVPERNQGHAGALSDAPISVCATILSVSAHSGEGSDSFIKVLNLARILKKANTEADTVPVIIATHTFRIFGFAMLSIRKLPPTMRAPRVKSTQNPGHDFPVPWNELIDTYMTPNKP
jgi:hypothetical protein